MSRELQNKVVVVTGGAGGIGFSICDKYLEQGAQNAIIIDIDETRGKKSLINLTSKYGEKVIFIQGDVTTDLDRIFKIIVGSHKTVDVLVHAAGIGDETIPKRVIDIHLTAVIDWSLKFEEIMRTDRCNGKGGTIVIIASVYGFRVLPFASVYQASQFGVIGYAKSVGHSRNFNKTGLRVIALCPGMTETKLTLPLVDPNYQGKIKKDFVAYLKEQAWQKVDAVGETAVEVFKRADSGSVWVIEDGKLTEMKSDV